MRVRVPRSRVTHDRWLVSYADFITLLFAFFVVLYATSMSRQKNQAQVSAAIDSAFQSLGIFGSASRTPSTQTGSQSAEHPATPMNIVMGEDVLSPATVKDDLQQLKHNLQQRLSNQVAQHTVSLQMGNEGLVISLREAGFFDSGAARPKPPAVDALRKIGEALARTPYNIRVEGHTDNVPIHTNEFDSNWELSAARATVVARLLLALHQVSPERLSAAGYAEFHPVGSNNTAAGRANNRRVDLVISPRSRINFASSVPSSAGGEWHKITDGDEPSE